MIELIQQRSDIQERASREMRDKFAAYNLELQEVLIGTPKSAPNDEAIETILTQLRARQIAEEQIATFAQQQKAAMKERELREAASRAEQWSEAPRGPEATRGGSSLLEALLAIVLSDKLGDASRDAGHGSSHAPPEIEQLRSGIRSSLLANLRSENGNGKDRR